MENRMLQDWAAACLRGRADDVRGRFQKRVPTLEELNEIFVLEKLAEDAKNISASVATLFEMMMLIKGPAAHLQQTSQAFFKQMNSRIAPRDASELVRLLMLQTLLDVQGSDFVDQRQPLRRVVYTIARRWVRRFGRGFRIAGEGGREALRNRSRREDRVELFSTVCASELLCNISVSKKTGNARKSV